MIYFTQKINTIHFRPLFFISTWIPVLRISFLNFTFLIKCLYGIIFPKFLCETVRTCLFSPILLPISIKFIILISLIFYGEIELRTWEVIFLM